MVRPFPVTERERGNQRRVGSEKNGTVIVTGVVRKEKGPKGRKRGTS